MNEETEWLRVPAASVNDAARRAAEARQAVLTKPPGALGKLEDTAIRLAALQGTEQPRVDVISIVVFAADHGVAVEGVSAFPQAVTGEMLKNFVRGGAAISVLARELGAKLEVINLGTISGHEFEEGITNVLLGSGTANLCHEPAMNQQQLARALHAGRQAAERARLAGTQLFIGGEMGIGNTTAATALACALLDVAPEQLVGPGTGLDMAGVVHKAGIVRKALFRHSHHHTGPLSALRGLGGFEIAALTGSYMACAHMGLPVLVDGFISSVAALAASRLCSGAEKWFLFSHLSREPGHQIVLADLNAQPLVDFGMRLGEGSGAAVVVPLLRMACALHNDMATFAEAHVSGKPLPA